MNDKIMAGVNLESVANRLFRCCSLLNVVHAHMAGGDICVDALGGVCDLMESICVDFRVDIDSADDAPATTDSEEGNA